MGQGGRQVRPVSHVTTTQRTRALPGQAQAHTQQGGEPIRDRFLEMVAHAVQESEALPYDGRRTHDGCEHLQGVAVHNGSSQEGPTPERDIKHVSRGQEAEREILQHDQAHMHGRESGTPDAVRERGCVWQTGGVHT